MSVESKIYASGPAITCDQLIAAAGRRGLSVRVFATAATDEGTLAPRDPDALLGGKRQSDHVVLGWPSSDGAVTAAVESAVRAGDKAAIDRLGGEGKLAWCELNAGHFDYEEFWNEFPDERPEYEESVEPERLAAIKASSTRYGLRSGTRPPLNGELLVSLTEVLREATGGVAEE